MIDPPIATTDLLDHATAATRLGCKRAKFFNDVRAGLMTRPIRLNGRVIRWPLSDVERILRARLVGADDADIRSLVIALQSERRTALKAEGLVR